MTEIPPLRLSSIFYFNIPQTFCASGCTSAGAKCRCGRSIFPPHQKRGNFLLTRIVICGILIKRLRDTVRRSGGTGRRPGLKIPWEEIPVPVRPRSSAPNPIYTASGRGGSREGIEVPRKRYRLCLRHSVYRSIAQVIKKLGRAF